MGEGRGDRAVVIGGGIGGLVTSRTLVDHFDEVVLVERDVLPEGAEPRRGVPHAHHVHGLLARGRQSLEDLFPGLGEELCAQGTPVFDHGEMAATTVWAGTAPRVRAGVAVHTFTRDLLEAALRGRVAALDGVVIRDATPVEGLHVEQPRGPVRGVLLHGDDGPEVLTADLVVDASGRFSALPDWLADLGYPRPETTVVDAQLGYATRLFEGPELSFMGAQQANSAPDRPRGTYVARVEGGRWLVTLFGADGDHPPAQEEGWTEFARSLHNEAVDAVLDAGSPVSEIHRFTRTENRRTEYARMSRWPERLIAVADSVCALNPVYGQGMTVSILEAAALGEALEGWKGATLDGFAARFQRRVAKLVRQPWMMSISEDLIWQYHREGRRPPALLRVSNWYKQRLLHLITVDLPTYELFLRAYNMLRPPTALGAPRTAAKVLFRARSPQRAGG